MVILENIFLCGPLKTAGTARPITGQYRFEDEVDAVGRAKVLGMYRQ
jgi:hypothetical protein